MYAKYWRIRVPPRVSLTKQVFEFWYLRLQVDGLSTNNSSLRRDTSRGIRPVITSNSQVVIATLSVSQYLLQIDAPICNLTNLLISWPIWINIQTQYHFVIKLAATLILTSFKRLSACKQKHQIEIDLPQRVGLNSDYLKIRSDLPEVDVPKGTLVKVDPDCQLSGSGLSYSLTVMCVDRFEGQENSFENVKLSVLSKVRGHS